MFGSHYSSALRPEERKTQKKCGEVVFLPVHVCMCACMHACACVCLQCVLTHVHVHKCECGHQCVGQRQPQMFLLRYRLPLLRQGLSLACYSLIRLGLLASESQRPTSQVIEL